ncbi:D-alpha,beta-D-heptose 1,7-bisphosphate phosphatase [Nitrosospira sp. Nl5]|uniref:HAD family hydrolase n=1 Tax=Nitrosospira sp. Nl5 TaxID=200120 RepID=UPI0008877776|nr:HAD family hydrolase [Nitrosospira sp. Nl5]SCY21294.1 D-alpha,beta-D-heptose 1,7-bisphosphate phosphatase [Nitrosospira sp. Nl5]
MSPLPGNRPALFLDRDGVINAEKNYVNRIEDFEFVDGIFDLCRSAVAAGMAIVVVTNQAGIGRGYYSEAQFLSVTEWMVSRFAEEGIVIGGVYYCPYHPEHGIGGYKADSFDRKPNPGMILRARDELGLSLERSILVGDKASDIAAARAASVGRAVLLAPSHVPPSSVPDLQADSLHKINELLFGPLIQERHG